jgi:hypothetical protein
MSMIRALYDFEARGEYELSFKAGKIFFVVDESDPEWYEVKIDNNDYKMVPKTYFEPVSPQNSFAPKSLPVFAVFATDFNNNTNGFLKGEVEDQLTVLAFENGMFLGKHLTKLNDIGLIPASVLKVEKGDKWRSLPSIKEFLANHPKLRYIEAAWLALSNGGKNRRKNSFGSKINVYISNFTLLSNKECAFLIEVENGRETYSVVRVFEEFVELQKSLLNAFPKEAGKTGGIRTIPYLPTSLGVLDDTGVKKACQEVNRYLRQLVELPEFISRSVLVSNFLDNWKKLPSNENPGLKISIPYQTPKSPLSSKYSPMRAHVSSLDSGSSGVSRSLLSEDDVNQRSSQKFVTKLDSLNESDEYLIKSNPEREIYIKIEVFRGNEKLKFKVKKANLQYQALLTQLHRRTGWPIRGIYGVFPNQETLNISSDADISEAITNGVVSLKAYS